MCFWHCFFGLSFFVAHCFYRTLFSVNFTSLSRICLLALRVSHLLIVHYFSVASLSASLCSFASLSHLFPHPFHSLLLIRGIPFVQRRFLEAFTTLCHAILALQCILSEVSLSQTTYMWFMLRFQVQNIAVKISGSYFCHFSASVGLWSRLASGVFI